MKRKWRRNEELTTEKSEDDVNWKFQTEIGGLWILLIDLKIEFTTKYQIILHDLIIISTSQFATCFSKFAQILCKYNVDHITKLVLLSENWVGQIAGIARSLSPQPQPTHQEKTNANHE